jgi:hypothetical protein
MSPQQATKKRVIIAVIKRNKNMKKLYPINIITPKSPLFFVAKTNLNAVAKLVALIVDWTK